MAVQRLENLYTFILRQSCWCAKNACQPIFPYNVTENSPASLTYDSVFNGPNDFKFVTETYRMVLQVKQNLGNIDDNLRNHIFDDII